MEQRIILELLNQYTDVPADMDENYNLKYLGISSIQIMEIASKLRRMGYRVTFAKMISNATLKEWSSILKKAVRKKVTNKKVADYKAFELTDIQYAYWIGRKQGQYLGGVDCHLYIETEAKNIVAKKAEKAWNEVRACHGMLHAKFHNNGLQEILPDYEKQHVPIHDLQSYKGEALKKETQSIRERLSHRILDIESGEVAGFELTLLPEGKTRFHLDFSLIIADVQSIRIILRDFAKAYISPGCLGIRNPLEFKEYLENKKTHEDIKESVAKQYWEERLKDYDLMPDIPLKLDPKSITDTRFQRIQTFISEKVWSNICKKASEYDVTPAMVLATVYGYVLKNWSRNDKFVINMPLFDRSQEYLDGVDDVVADFSNLMLLGVDYEKSESFLNKVLENQKRFHKDVEYSTYTGIQVLRDRAKVEENGKSYAPVVFACNTGDELFTKEYTKVFGEDVYMLSQTPQIWIDFQCFDKDGGLHLIWDHVPGLFPDGMIEDMFYALEHMFYWLEEHCDDWNKVPEIETKYSLPKLEIEENEQIKNASYGLLSKFIENVEKNPEKVALIDYKTGLQKTYKDLYKDMRSIAAALMEEGVMKNQRVAVTMERGWKQVTALLGVLAAGCTYVPLNCKHPMNRKNYILDKAEINYIITTENKNENYEGKSVLTIEWLLKHEPLEDSVHCGLDDIAYIIFTSGSTGMPKGVQISHYGAMNTIYDINDTYHIGVNDCMLLVSSVDFDLSVYDMFGALSAGGRLVIISDEISRNAEVWIQLCNQYKVTIWNSVPVLFDMLLLAADMNHLSCESLRVVLLSGDWVGLDLRERLNKVSKTARMISLGGATEASIWSNSFEVKKIESDWKSIPYGYALKNQAYQVVKETGEICPAYVEGELLIGGAGVAAGYIGDPELTKNQFIEKDGVRWYKTGDMGCYWKNGIIEFLGRRDSQVKVRGHRIELGEIEAALNKQERINKAVVTTKTDLEGTRHLIGFIVPEFVKENTSPKEMDWDSTIFHAKELQKEYDVFKEAVETIGSQYVFKNFQQFELFNHKDESYTLGEMFVKAGIIKQYECLFETWVTFLVKNKYLVKEVNRFKVEKNAELFFEEQVEFGNRINKKLIQFLDQFTMNSKEILTGKMEMAELVTNENYISPEEIASVFPGMLDAKKAVVHNLKRMVSDKEEIRVFLLNPRNSDLVDMLLDLNEHVQMHITIADTSLFYVKRYKQNYQNCNIVESLYLSSYDNTNWEGEYDIALLDNSLHKENPEQVLLFLHRILREEGKLLVLERTKDSTVLLVTQAMLESAAKAEDAELNGLLNGEETWKKIVESQGYSYLSKMPDTERLDFGVLLFAKRNMEILSEKEIASFLAQYVPEYMIPNQYVFLNKMPISANGKIDRKSLQAQTDMIDIQALEEEYIEPRTEYEKKLAKIWSEVLNIEKISRNSDYFKVGGDSLLAMHILEKIKTELGKDIGIDFLFQYPVLKEQAEQIEKSKVMEESTAYMVPDVKNRYKPFPLTDVQQSYWLGRSGAYALGDVSNHCYFELDCERIDIKEAENAWNMLIQKHDMMRAVILPDGQHQKVLKKVPEYKIELFDSKESDMQENEFARMLREKMSHYKFNCNNWPAFYICISRYEIFDRIHVNFDNIIYDGYSMFHLLKEWNEQYSGKVKKEDSTELSFRDYVLEIEKRKNTADYKEAMEYWKQRVFDLPQAPQLALQSDPSKLEKQHYKRMEFRLEREDWKQLKEMAKNLRLTGTGVLLTAFAEILGRWSKSYHFTLNLTLFRKEKIHPDVEKLIGDFTSLILVEVDLRKRQSFLENCRNVQERLWKDLSYANVSGVEVEREYVKYNHLSNEIVMPIVFTSGIGMDKEDALSNQYLGKINYSISQTPQVWLDHQIREEDGTLVLSWDILEGIFRPGMIESMFDAYQKLLKLISAKEKAWDVTYEQELIAVDTTMREKRNATKAKVYQDTLPGLFLRNLKTKSKEAALITSKKIFTYEMVNQYAEKIAGRLQGEKLQPQSLVAIVMEKGWEQVVSTLGIMMANYAYLPIDSNFPIDRIDAILEEGKVEVLLTQPELKEKLLKCKVQRQIYIDEMVLNWTDRKKPDVINESGLAYVIFTSGTTGVPKGVMIEHKAAVNTILHVNNRFQITSQDKTIAISNLNFDLSVYDIYGMWAAGGAIVIPDAEQVKNPAHWVQLIEKYEITTWNTVPALMQMLAEYLEMKEQKLMPIRKIMLSGDWIPITLPDRIRTFNHQAQIISLGGATEASIWSNYYKVQEVDENWKSIPYGYPLENQYFSILNERLEPCPDYVPGNLYIGGLGLARGYFGNETLTNEKFITHPDTSERLYFTGDMGLYDSDGCMEFLGRNDNQVKMNGFRIELDDIENTVRKLSGITHAITHVLDNKIYLDIVLDETGTNKYMAETEYENLITSEALEEKNQDLLQTGIEEFSEIIEYCEHLDSIVLSIMKKVFKTLFHITSQEVRVTDEMIEELNISNTYKHILHLWNQVLLKERKHTENNSLTYEKTYSMFKEDMTNEITTQLDLIEGRTDMLQLIEAGKSKLLPSYIGKYQKKQNIYTDYIKKSLMLLDEKNNEKKKILEIGSRVNDHTQELFRCLSTNDTYIYTDASPSYLERKKDTIYSEERIVFERLDFNQSFVAQGFEEHSIHVVLADNVLHRANNMDKSLEEIKKVLIAGGILIINELTVNYALQLLTTYHFENGYQNITDDRKSSGQVLINMDEWTTILEKHGFTILGMAPDKTVAANQRCIVAMAPTRMLEFASEQVITDLKEMLPNYMMPAAVKVLSELPLSANGKVDRKQIEERWKIEKRVKKAAPMRETTSTEKKVISIWNELLTNEAISLEDDFFNCGGDSLKAMKVIHKVNVELAVELTLTQLFDHSSVEKFAALIDETIKEKVGADYVEGTI